VEILQGWTPALELTSKERLRLSKNCIACESVFLPGFVLPAASFKIALPKFYLNENKRRYIPA
jgi:hypothetical protein